MPSTQRIHTHRLLVAVVAFALFSVSAMAQSETILYNFQGGTADGRSPWAA